MYSACSHGSTCVTQGADYICHCPDGSRAKQCDVISDTCDDVTCLHGGNCLSVNGTLTCECPVGFSGQLCEIQPDSCIPDPCLNGGMCIMMDGHFQCVCPPRWKGSICHIQYHPTCDKSPCLNDGQCITNSTLEQGYYCICPTHVNDEDSDDVLETLVRIQANPYQNRTVSGRNYTDIANVSDVNNGHINNGVNVARIMYGHNCEILTACDSAPCLNRGTCVNLALYDYMCACPAEFSGRNCEYIITTPVLSTTVRAQPSSNLHIGTIGGTTPITAQPSKGKSKPSSFC